MSKEEQFRWLLQAALSVSTRYESGGFEDATPPDRAVLDLLLATVRKLLES